MPTMTKADVYALLESDESLRLKETAAEKGWNLVYLLKSQDSEGCVPPGIVKAKLYEGDAGAPFFFWLSSESEVATVLQEVAGYLESLDPEDPGIQRAEAGREAWKDIQEIAVRAGEARLWLSSSEEGGATRSLAEMDRVKEGGIWVKRHNG